MDTSFELEGSQYENKPLNWNNIDGNFHVAMDIALPNTKNLGGSNKKN